MEDMGNPFRENSSYFLVLDTRNVAEAAVINTVNQIEELGQDKYYTYVSERLVHRTKPIINPIKRNSLLLFSQPQL